MEILKAERKDLPRILEIQKICYAREVERTNDADIPPMRQTLPELETESGRCLILKGVENGSIIGSVRAELEDGACKIGRLVVLPERRGKGNGSALLRAIEASFPQAERYELFTGSLSQDNIRLYEKAGYRQFSVRPVNEKYCLVYLEKDGQASRRPLDLGIDFAGIPFLERRGQVGL